MAKDDWDLEPTSRLKRTGLKGELISEQGRQEELARAKKTAKDSQPAGLLKKWANVDIMLNTPEQTKYFKAEEKRKEAALKESLNRIKELKTRR